MLLRGLSIALILALTGCSLFQSDAEKAQKRYDRYVQQSIKAKRRQQEVIRKQQANEAASPEEQDMSRPTMEVTTAQ